jgi:Kdo2-lipid IVA lauroyltransferase/acyltransferase
MIDTELTKKNKSYYESFWKRTSNNIIVSILKILSYLPFWFIYGLSDVFYIVVRYVIKYRKNVIHENLTFAFPEKTEVEIKQISGKFYRHFCDFSLETLKMYSLSEKQLRKRVRFKGMAVTEELYNQGKSIIMLGMHHNNWEWCSAVQLFTKHLTLMLYNPVRGNQAFEKFLIYSREKWGGICVPVHKSARTVFQFNQMGKPTGIWLGADQTPGANSQFWTIFLNREAPFFSGPEKIAKKTNQPVFFHRTRKLKRGYYEVEFSLLFENPKDVNEKDILLGYVHKMEEVIREEPEYYLWSHRRWKHKRPEGIPLTLKTS